LFLFIISALLPYEKVDRHHSFIILPKFRRRLVRNMDLRKVLPFCVFFCDILIGGLLSFIPAQSHPRRHFSVSAQQSFPETSSIRELTCASGCVTNDQYRQHRLDSLKVEILQKLRLSAPPNISFVPNPLDIEPLKKLIEDRFPAQDAQADAPSSSDEDEDQFRTRVGALFATAGEELSMKVFWFLEMLKFLCVNNNRLITDPDER